MSMQQKFHKEEEVFNNNFYISEQCFYCQKEFTNIEEILVDCEDDDYLCQECALELNIITLPCMELNTN